MKTKPFPGWLAFVVLCNNTPIASFGNRKLADEFARDRQVKYPKNDYWTKENV